MHWCTHTFTLTHELICTHISTEQLFDSYTTIVNELIVTKMTIANVLVLFVIAFVVALWVDWEAFIFVNIEVALEAY